MIAEIKGKVNKQNTNLTELGEDELTGNFFGNLRYIPFNKGMKKILKNSIRPIELQNMVDEIDIYNWNKNIHFWKRVRECERSIELDVILDFPSIIIGIEVKYRSGISSEDEKDAEDISAETSSNQLSKEARVLNLIGSGKKKLLLLLADELSCAAILQSVKIIDGVQLGYLSWQEVLIQLKKLIDLNDFEKLVISDIIELLERKGFTRFSDFKIDIIDIFNMDYWKFELPILNSYFSFNYDKIIEEKYYEFR